MRVHSNIAEYPNRRLAKKFDNAGTAAGTARAVGISAPTTRKQSMGRSGRNGVVSFLVDDGGNQAFTILEWHEGLAKVNSGNGWVLNGANSAEYTKTCDVKAKISFTVSEGVPFFIYAGTAPCTNCFISGTEDDANKNTDISDGITH